MAAAISLYDAVSYTSGAWDSIAGMFSTIQTEGDEEGLMEIDYYGGMAGMGDELQDGREQDGEPQEEDHFDLPKWIKNGVKEMGNAIGQASHWLGTLIRGVDAQFQVETLPSSEEDLRNSSAMTGAGCWDANVGSYLGSDVERAKSVFFVSTTNPNGSTWDYLHVQPNKDDRDRGTAYWAYAPGEGIKLGNAVAIPGIGGARAGWMWDIHLDKQFGGGIVNERAARKAVRRFMEVSKGQSVSEFDKKTQRTFIRDMLDLAKKGLLGEKPAKLRATQARLWLEQHPEARYGSRPMPEGPQMGAPGTPARTVSKRIRNIFRDDWIIVDQDWGSWADSTAGRFLLGEQSGASTDPKGVDPRAFDDKKDQLGGSVKNRQEAREEAIKWATNLTKNFKRVVMMTDNSGPGYFRICPAGKDGEPSGPQLPYWTDRRAKHDFNKLGDFTVIWGADTVIGGWIGYPIPKGGHELAR